MNPLKPELEHRKATPFQLKGYFLLPLHHLEQKVSQESRGVARKFQQKKAQHKKRIKLNNIYKKKK